MLLSRLPFGHSDMMLKPLEKMYGYAGMAAGMPGMAGMAAPYYGMHPNLTEAQFGSAAAAAGMHHHSMSGAAVGPTSFVSMVS